MRLPVLLLFFNRKEPLTVVVDSVRAYKPPRIYLASDGPRELIGGEVEAVLELRKYVLEIIDWDCEIKTLYRDKNLGCKKAVHEAVQWFFSQEEKGIVLEDDIAPSSSFFDFCESALEVYKDDNTVSSIGGRNELGEYISGQDDIIFSSKFFCWGWASWADRILGIDISIASDSLVKNRVLRSVAKKEKRLVEGMYGLIESAQVNSWAYQYDIHFRNEGMFQILPSRNMVTNIGLGIQGTHSAGRSNDLVKRFDNFTPVVDASKRLENEEFINRYIDKRFNSYSLFIFSKVKYLKIIRTLMRKLR